MSSFCRQFASKFSDMGHFEVQSDVVKVFLAIGATRYTRSALGPLKLDPGKILRKVGYET